MCAAASGRMCCSSAARCSVIRANRCSQAAASASRSASPAPARQESTAVLTVSLRRGDALVLALHPRHRLGDVGRHPRLQHRPEQPVLADVVVVQQGAEQVQVVGDDGGAVGVARGHAAHEGRRLAELPADRVVHHHHVAGVDAGGGGGGHAGFLSSEREEQGAELGGDGVDQPVDRTSRASPARCGRRVAWPRATRRRWRCRRPSRRGAGRGRPPPAPGVGSRLCGSARRRPTARRSAASAAAASSKATSRPLARAATCASARTNASIGGRGRRVRQSGRELGAVGQRHVLVVAGRARGRRRRAAGPVLLPWA